MNNGKVRIYELSKELNLENRDILAVCEQLNISVKSHSSTITEAEAARIRAAANKFPLQPVQKKQQILEIYRLSSPKQPPSPELPSSLETPSQPSQLPLGRTSRTSQGYIEPLLHVGSALPLHMVLIPRGMFKMGSPEDESERRHNEGPQHNVNVPSFFIGRHPITQVQWRFVAGLSPVKQKLDPEPSNFNGKDNYPVEQVSWYDAIEFCARLEKHTNRPYRLPTEAEWEFACRAGTSTPFYFGNTLTNEIANYDASAAYANGPVGTKLNRTTSVDYFGIANALGLSDMHGNVWEWCQDHWHDNYEGAPTNGSAWLTGYENAFRILRGGSWKNDPEYCRSAHRNNLDPSFSNSSLGFRVCCSAFRTV